MRLHRFALISATLLALSSFSFNGFAHADEAAAVTPDTETMLTPDALVEPEKIEFQAEVSRILDIVVNSLYQNKDVFLRELISNASDALDKIRFLSITNPELMKDKDDLEIRINFNAEENTLTITDSGIGMTKQELIENLGTVARSGTTKFMDAMKEGADIEQIGMFGVGFYSTFLVADKVTVASKNPGEDEQHIWMSSNGDSSFSVAKDPRGNTLGRGTEITLQLKDDAFAYANFDMVSSLVHHYSEFVTHPIYVRKAETMEVPEEDEEDTILDEKDDEFDISEEEDADVDDKKPKMKEVKTYSWEKCNADQAIWNRSKEDITDDEYQEFFKMATKNVYNASAWSHFDAEGNINFKSLVYMPHRVPDSLRTGDLTQAKSQMRLYVRKVLISDEFQLLPRYMSFVTGVVDSEDLPLNVNRETLQESKIISIIRKKVTRKVIDMIKKFSEEDFTPEEPPEEEEEEELDEDGDVIEKYKKELDTTHPYIKWYKKFHPSLKMGVMEDEPNRKRLSKLIRFQTSKSGEEYISFDDYIVGMKDWQKDIFFAAGSDIKELEKSPFMEKFNEKDVEVIFFTEPADEYMIQHMEKYDDKSFTTISKEGISLESDEEKDEATRRHKVYSDLFKPLTKFMNRFYGTKVMSVSVSKRLGSVPAIMSSSAYGQSANMERIMRAQAFAHHQNENAFIEGMRTLEINPRHPFIERLNDLIDFEDEDAELPQELKDSLWNLMDTALINGGYPVAEGKGFTNRMMRTIRAQLKVESMKLSPEIAAPLIEDVPPETEEEKKAEEKANLQEIVDHMDDLSPDDVKEEMKMKMKKRAAGAGAPDEL